MKTLIAVLSCERDRWAHDQARQTWLKSCPVDYRFFVGIESFATHDDEVKLNEPDASGTLKMRAVFQRALEQDYDYLFKCDIDTYVHVPRLLKSGFEQHDWVANGNPLRPYGGSGYWLSRKALVLLQQGSDQNTARPYNEDWWVGDNLRKFGLTPHIDKRYHSDTGEGPRKSNDLITSHWYGKRQS